MRTLSKYSPWQSEMVVTASLLKLDLLSDNQMVEYTHYLLDNEYYDDEMLSIIDDDPIYPRGNKESLQRALSSLGFPDINTEQAKWIYTYVIVHVFIEQPENYHVFEDSQLDIYNKFYEFLDEGSHLQAVDGFKGLIYQLDDTYGNVKMGDVYEGYNDPSTLLILEKEFFQLCKQLIKDNKPKIECIFATTYAEINL